MTGVGAFLPRGDGDDGLSAVCAGSPTIVLEVGLGDDVAIWRYVQPALAHRTRVCAYDRAGNRP